MKIRDKNNEHFFTMTKNIKICVGVIIVLYANTGHATTTTVTLRSQNKEIATGVVYRIDVCANRSCVAAAIHFTFL